MRVEYRGRVLWTRCRKRRDGRFSVAVAIGQGPASSDSEAPGQEAPGQDAPGRSRAPGGRRASIYRDDGVSFILEVEAELESLALGRRVVDSGGA